MDYKFDYEEVRRINKLEAELRNSKKFCPRCKHYVQKDPMPNNGSAKGFCALKKEKYPDKHLWWDVSLKNTCHQFEDPK